MDCIKWRRGCRVVRLEMGRVYPLRVAAGVHRGFGTGPGLGDGVVSRLGLAG